MASVPHTEDPIYVEYVQRGDHYHYDDANDTAAERRPTSGRECWIGPATVPAAPPPLAPYPGGPVVGNTRGVAGVQLTAVPGNAFRFAYQGAPPQRFADMVPGNYSAGAYRPALRDARGRAVPYNPSVWVADGLFSLVEFKYQTPQALGYEPPFTLDYWRYVGAFASGPLTLANEGGGAEVYDTSTAATLRTLVGAPADGLTVTQGPATIALDNTLTGLNLIEPASLTTGRVFKQKNGSAQLELRTLQAGLNVTLQETAVGILINAAPGGAGISGLANEGAGADIFDSIVGTTAVLRRLNAGAGGLSVTQNPADITIDNTLTGANVGAGAGVFRNKAAGNLNLRSLVAGANVTVTQNADDITIAAPAALTSLANEGGGAQVWDSGTPATLRTLLGTAGGLVVTQNAATITVDNTLTGANPSATPGSADVFEAKVGALLNFRSLVAGANVTVTQGSPTANDVTIAAPAALTSLANEGGGAQVWDSGTAATLRTLLGTANGLTVTQNATTVTIDNTLTGANLGAGAGTVFSAKSAAALQFNSLAGTANGLTVSAPAAGTITVDNTLTGANPSATPGGADVFEAKVGALLNFRSLVAGANVTVTQGSPTADDITIAAPAALTSLANEGGGAQVWDSGTSATLRTLLGTANGLTVTQNATTVTVDNTLTGVNVGAGAGVFQNKTGASLNLRSLVAGANITVTQNANDVTIAAASPDTSYTRTPVNVAVYNVLATDDILAVLYTPTGTVTLNLPLIAGLGGPKRYSIVDEGGAAFVHPITVAAAGGNTIIGLASVVIENNYNSINIYHNGTTGWFIA